MTSCRPIFVALTALAVAGGVPSCAAKESKPAAGSSAVTAAAEITVNATDTECALSATEGPAGLTTFVVTNNGTKPTELYVYGKDGTVLAEMENISPGLHRRLQVEFNEAGAYKLACKPGMVGDSIGSEFTVKTS